MRGSRNRAGGDWKARLDSQKPSLLVWASPCAMGMAGMKAQGQVGTRLFSFQMRKLVEIINKLFEGTPLKTSWEAELLGG